MTKKIFRSILAASLAVLLVSLVIVMGCLYEYFGRVQEDQLRDELRLAAYGVEESGQSYFEKLTARDYRYPRTPDYRLTWVAPDGTVLFDTVDSAGQMDNHADRVEIQEAFVSGESSSVRYSATLTRRTLYCARLLNNGTVLRISISRATPLTLALAMFQPILLVAGAAVILRLSQSDGKADRPPAQRPGPGASAGQQRLRGADAPAAPYPPAAPADIRPAPGPAAEDRRV